MALNKFNVVLARPQATKLVTFGPVGPKGDPGEPGADGADAGLGPLENASDVNAVGKTNGSVLQWNGVSEEWITVNTIDNVILDGGVF